MAYPTVVDPADRAVGPLSPLPCHARHGYGASTTHHGEVRECSRACVRTPSGAVAAAPPAGAVATQLKDQAGGLQPFSYMARKPNAAERGNTCSAYDSKALAVCEAVKHWRC
jgi:hypothetical protein